MLCFPCPHYGKIIRKCLLKIVNNDTVFITSYLDITDIIPQQTHWQVNMCKYLYLIYFG